MVKIWILIFKWAWASNFQIFFSYDFHSSLTADMGPERRYDISSNDFDIVNLIFFEKFLNTYLLKHIFSEIWIIQRKSSRGD